MNSGLDATEYTLPAELTAPARALFGGDVFATRAWYDASCQYALPPGAMPAFVEIRRGHHLLALVPMQRHRTRRAALTTPYTCLWHPLGAADLTAQDWKAAGTCLARWCKGSAVTRLDALDPQAPWFAPMLSGLRAGGLVPLRFDHFGNWHTTLPPGGWEAYLAGRPGALRETIRRRGNKLRAAGAIFTQVRDSSGLAPAIRAYESIYAKSWKEPEPFPHFNPALIRACASDGTLRLGLLIRDGTPVAAQFWVVRDRWAAVLKLAHDEDARADAPGTVLTAYMIETLMQQDNITELDFGRGDDAYKADWTGSRRQRVGVLLADPWRPSGMAAIARHLVGGMRK